MNINIHIHISIGIHIRIRISISRASINTMVVHQTDAVRGLFQCFLDFPSFPGRSLASMRRGACLAR